jgi:hypothetical protein
METYINFQNVIRHIDKDGLYHFIPKDNDNIDYQKYLSHEETQADRDAQAEYDAEVAAKETATATQTTAKAALLTQLGITEEQAKLLLS